MRTLCVLGMLAALWVPLPGQSVASVPSCRGEQATIVGSPGEEIRGTDGADVILSNGARRVDGLDGDDLICMTRKAKGASRVRGGPGDDRIWVTQRPPRTTVVPGAGDDVVVGGPGDELVLVDSRASDGPSGVDVIRTGGGDDFVNAEGTGDLAHRIALGDGADGLSVTSEARFVASGLLAGGGGVDELYVGGIRTSDPRALVMDNGRGVATVDGNELFRWSSFESFGVPGGRNQLMTFVGSEADETLETTGHPSLARFIDMRGGDDAVFIESPGKAGATVRGGQGRDSFRTHYIGVDVDVDVVRGSSEASGRLEVGDVRLAGLERFEVSVVGPRQLHMRGGPGSDVLKGSSRGLVLEGRGGNDRLVGDYRSDVLIGGPGTDVGIGGRGSDRCVSIERRRSCERP